MEIYGERDNRRYVVSNQELLAQTHAYPISDASIVVTPTKEVPDIATGGKRKRRYGLVLAVAGIPGFEHMEDPVLLNAGLPKVLLDGDSMEILRERAHAELDAMFNLFEDTVNGTVDIEGKNEQ